jgi:D,D-heptose 1,7-bisphosphate phosphatase
MTSEAKAIILAGGLGTRLRPLTDTLPNCLVPNGGRPLLDYWVDALADAGIREARVNNHAHADQVRAYVEQVSASGRLRLDESYEPELLGSAGTIAANPDLADGADAVVIVYADNFSDVDLRAMLAFHRSHDDPFTMLLFRAPNPSTCGIAELDDEGRVVSFVEKPKEPKSNLANGGVYVVDAEAYREIAALKAFDLGFEVLPKFVGRMRGWAWEGYHLDVGTHEALEKARCDAPGVMAGLRERGQAPGEYTRSQSPFPAPGTRPAVFLDRDGTVIEQVHYLGDPARVRLLPGAASALRRLRDAGYALVVITNQSAIGRGWLTVEQYGLVNDEMVRQLAAEGVTLDGVYYCPEVPTTDEDRLAITHGDRKPGPGMLLRAGRELGLDLSTSWMIGDMISDVLAGINAGCKGSLLVETGKKFNDGDAPPDLDLTIVADLPAAADLILGSTDDRTLKGDFETPKDLIS